MGTVSDKETVFEKAPYLRTHDIWKGTVFEKASYPRITAWSLSSSMVQGQRSKRLLFKDHEHCMGTQHQHGVMA